MFFCFGGVCCLKGLNHKGFVHPEINTYLT